MSQALQWSLQENQLVLSGELGSDTLLPLWNARAEIAPGMRGINLQTVTRVDTGGIALLLHLMALSRDHGNSPVITGGDANLHTLVTLYNLPPELIPFDVA